MLSIKRSNSENIHFEILVSQLNSYLKTVDGEDHEFYMQYNGIESLNNVVIAYENQLPVGCGAFKKFNSKSVELKRMFTSPEYRNKRIASKILKELETWAEELGYTSCILETGKRQIEAVEFYQKNSYSKIENFGQYRDVDNSICFEKQLKHEKG